MKPTTAVRWVVLAAALGLGGCESAGPPRSFNNNDLELAVGNAARMACSCLWVMNRDEAYCRAWVKASPDVARFSYDANRKTVEASSFISWAATARYVDDKRGCILE